MIYFPKPYPGEIGGSLIARACRHLGISYKQLIKDITGTPRANAPFLIIPYLARVARLARIEPEEFLWQHTAFPYVTAFMSPSEMNRYRDLILLDPQRAQNKIGAIIQYALDGVPYRRYCKTCLEQDLAKLGEPYWRQIHNLPAVYLCPDHNEKLQFTRLPIPRVAISKSYSLPGDSSSKLIDAGVSDATLLALSIQTKQLLARSHTHRTGWHGEYRSMAIQRGFQLANGDVAGNKLSKDMRAFYGSALLRKANADIAFPARDPWPGIMIRPQPGIPFSPVKHVLLNHYLSEVGLTKKLAEYPVGGRKSLDHSAADLTLSHSLKRVILKVQKCDKKYTVTQLMNQVGMWQQFRNNRSKYPTTNALLRSFTASRWAVRQNKNQQP